MLGAEVGDNGGRDDAEIEALARFVSGEPWPDGRARHVIVRVDPGEGMA
jgi:hypothetical protein